MVKAAKAVKVAKTLKYGATQSLWSWTRGTTWLQTLVQSIPFLLLPFAGNLIGYLFTGMSPARYSRGEWQRRLTKPWFTPPDWVFGPVWTLLYLAMGLASYIVWRTAGGLNMHSQWPLILYGLSLLLNWLWPLLYFVKGKLLWSALCITALWGVVAATLGAFWHVHRLAGMLLIPYLAWLTLAAIINWFIVAKNAEPNLAPNQQAGGSGWNAKDNNNTSGGSSGGSGTLRQRSRLSGKDYDQQQQQQAINNNGRGGGDSGNGAVYARNPSGTGGSGGDGRGSSKQQQQQTYQQTSSASTVYQRPNAGPVAGGDNNNNVIDDAGDMQ